MTEKEFICLTPMSLRSAAALLESSPAIRKTTAFIFFSAVRAFNIMEGQCFSDPLTAERMARMLAKHGSLPRDHDSGHPRRTTLPRRFG
ncbi:MAG TPA: hypothetical protein VL996_11130 [Methylocella sp.]|nr:hypothetical protein [Methylocella sp.]